MEINIPVNIENIREIISLISLIPNELRVALAGILCFVLTALVLSHLEEEEPSEKKISLSLTLRTPGKKKASARLVYEPNARKVEVAHKKKPGLVRKIRKTIHSVLVAACEAGVCVGLWNLGKLIEPGNPHITLTVYAIVVIVALYAAVVLADSLASIWGEKAQQAGGRQRSNQAHHRNSRR